MNIMMADAGSLLFGQPPLRHEAEPCSREAVSLRI